MAERPGDLGSVQPDGERLGSQGPDQGYVLTIAATFAGRLHLEPGEHERDALAGSSSVALKRASLFRRAPVVHDLTAALTIWGFLGSASAPELLTARLAWFNECHHPHFYDRLRRIADAVPAEMLHQPLTAILEQVAADWRAGVKLD